MKTKKMGLVAAIVLASVCFLSISAWSTDYTCTVVSAGFNAGTQKLFIKLTDDGAAFTDRMFRAPAGYENEYLATALTAMSSGLKVEAECNGVEWSYIWKMMLKTN